MNKLLNWIRTKLGIIDMTEHYKLLNEQIQNLEKRIKRLERIINNL